MSVDPVVRRFPFGSPAYGRLVTEFRRRVFEEYAASDGVGLIFTWPKDARCGTRPPREPFSWRPIGGTA